MSTFQLYVLLKLDAVVCLFQIIGTLLGIVGLMVFMHILFHLEDDDECTLKTRKKCFFIFKWLIPLTTICFSLGAFIPSTKEAAIIYVVPKVLNNAQVQAIPGKLLTLADEWIEKLRPENTESAAE